MSEPRWAKRCRITASNSTPFGSASISIPSIQTAHAFLERTQTFFLKQTGDPVLSKELAWQALQNLRQQQASALAYFDCFWVFAVVMLLLVPVVFLMRRSVAEKGAHAGVE